MAKVVVLGGGFGGVVAAKSLAKQLGDEHQITLVARSDRFVFYPALVRLTFGKCEINDASFDLRRSMLSRNVNFIEAEVARLDLEQRRVVVAHGEVEGNIPYDYLVFALGRRLATERTPGFFEHAHHLLDAEGALKFGQALRAFPGGRVVLGQCPGARLPLPVYETAFALAKMIREGKQSQSTKVMVVSPVSLESEFSNDEMSSVLNASLDRNGIEQFFNFPIDLIEKDKLVALDGRELGYDLLMLVPSFSGSAAASRLGITGNNGYINVDTSMKVVGVERMYAVGDCVNFMGPKMGHMAVRQAEVAATNLTAELQGHEPEARYNHESMMIIEGADGEAIYFHQDLWSDDAGSVRQGRFWNWAKRVHEKYFEGTHR